MALQTQRLVPGPIGRTIAGGAREIRLSGLGAAALMSPYSSVSTSPNQELRMAELKYESELALAKQKAEAELSQQQYRIGADITTAILQAGGQIGSAYLTSESQIKALSADRKTRMAELALQWQALGAGMLPPSGLRELPSAAPAVSPILLLLIGAGVLVFVLSR